MVGSRPAPCPSLCMPVAPTLPWEAARAKQLHCSWCFVPAASILLLRAGSLFVHALSCWFILAPSCCSCPLLAFVGFTCTLQRIFHPARSPMWTTAVSSRFLPQGPSQGPSSHMGFSSERGRGGETLPSSELERLSPPLQRVPRGHLK